MNSTTSICLFLAIVSILFYGLITNHSLAPAPPHVEIHTTNGTQSCAPVEMKKTEVQFYNQSSNFLYQFEYRYEFTEQKSSSQSRLMILLTGRHHQCIDWWSFSSGEKSLTHMRSSGFLILSICTARRSDQLSESVPGSQIVHFIYITLQKWMTDVYYKHFGHYPLLYLFGLREGSSLSASLCRVLPVQAQILYVDAGHSSLLLRSDHSRETQNRLIADPTFANWFYFVHCSKVDLTPDSQCPFRDQNKNFYHPVPPTHFVHAEKDHPLGVSNYTKMISDMRKDAFHLGGALLARNNSIKLSIVTSSTVTSTSMKDNFNKWFCKPWHSQLFYEHFVNSNTTSMLRRTCWCANKDFFYYTYYPNITKSWSEADQDKYRDYVEDIQKYRADLCKTFCGDILGYHQMLSREVQNTLQWVDEMDEQRSRYRIEDFLSRPLRLWMYTKDDLIRNKTHLVHDSPMNSSCARHISRFQMYSPEYFLQDYFKRLNHSYPLSRHNLVWARDPLLADYYIIPHDLQCLTLTEYKPSTTVSQLLSERQRDNKDYLVPLLERVRLLFPYWNMSAGSNHIITFTNGANMGSTASNLTYEILRNVVNLVSTGYRQDLLSQSAPPSYVQFGTVPIYRHNYDIIIPAFNRFQWINTQPVMTSSQWSQWYEQKRCLLFFAGTVNNSNMFNSVRRRLTSMIKKDIGEGKRYPNITTIEGKNFRTIVAIDGYVTLSDYIQSIRSSVFSLSPEGFSPWTPRLYEAISLGSIPLILATSVVLPFERFVDWRSFSTKISVEKVKNLVDLVGDIVSFEDHVMKKLQNATRYFHAFRWPYSPSDRYHDRHSFLPDEDGNGTTKNVFHYLSLELRCRRLEQLYGLDWNSSSTKSLDARRQVCRKYPAICPCSEEVTPIATSEYI